jgi:hypothetical protein
LAWPRRTSSRSSGYGRQAATRLEDLDGRLGRALISGNTRPRPSDASVPMPQRSGYRRGCAPGDRTASARTSRHIFPSQGALLNRDTPTVL